MEGSSLSFGRLTVLPFVVKAASVRCLLMSRARSADFRKIDGSPARLPRASCVLHVFNHGTHHRGQVTAAVTQFGGRAPEIDLPYFLYTLGPAALGD